MLYHHSNHSIVNENYNNFLVKNVKWLISNKLVPLLLVVQTHKTTAGAWYFILLWFWTKLEQALICNSLLT